MASLSEVGVPGSALYFTITIVDIKDGTTEVAATTGPNIVIEDESGTELQASTAMTLIPATTGQYEVTLNSLVATWVGELKDIITWTVGGSNYRRTDTFFMHEPSNR